MIRSIRLTLALVACTLLPVLPVGGSLVVCLPACGHWSVGVEGVQHHCACHEIARTQPTSCCDAGCGHRHDDAPTPPLAATDGCPCDCQDVPIETVDDGLAPEGTKGDRDAVFACAAQLVGVDTRPDDADERVGRPSPHPSPPPTLRALRTTVLRL